MTFLGAPRVLLLPLTRSMMATRLQRADFRLACDTPHSSCVVHFGAQWPGDALAMFPRLLSRLGEAPYVEGTFAVVERATQEAVGQVGTMGPADDHGFIEIGYGIVESMWGRAFATEAVGAITTHLLAVPSVVRVTAETAVGNIGSQRVLEANGFDRSGPFSSKEDGELILWARE